MIDSIAITTAVTFCNGPTVNPEPQQPHRTAAEGEDTQRAWAGLTEEEVEACFHHVDEAGIGLFDFADAIEAKLKAKNERKEKNTK